MRAFTVHVPKGAMPGNGRLVPEGFSMWAFVFGPLWLLLSGAWPFALVLALVIAFLPWPVAVAGAALAGLCGHDARRLMLERRGWQLTDVVLGQNSDEAELRWRQFAAKSSR